MAGEARGSALGGFGRKAVIVDVAAHQEVVFRVVVVDRGELVCNSNWLLPRVPVLR